jgi:hypothetical protein
MSGVAYVALGILALIVIAAVVVVVGGRRPTRISPILAIALAFVVAGIAFGENRWVGYTLIGIGVALAIADAIVSSRKGH